MSKNLILTFGRFHLANFMKECLPKVGIKFLLMDHLKVVPCFLTSVTEIDPYFFFKIQICILLYNKYRIAENFERQNFKVFADFDISLKIKTLESTCENGGI